MRSRFIPTRAGKMVRATRDRLRSAVHPHSRGENKRSHEGDPNQGGSSPLARGKCQRCSSSGGHVRFIPTRAGKIAVPRWETPARAVHPHSRGENCSTSSAGLRQSGSSPLARGKYGVLPDVIAGVGFIPTRAGKIGRDQRLWSSLSVHPHSRGENGPVTVGLRDGCGSSPLARGKSSLVDERVTARGFIPTRAGKMRRAYSEPVRA